MRWHIEWWRSAISCDVYYALRYGIKSWMDRRWVCAKTNYLLVYGTLWNRISFSCTTLHFCVNGHNLVFVFHQKLFFISLLTDKRFSVAWSLYLDVENRSRIMNLPAIDVALTCSLKTVKDVSIARIEVEEKCWVDISIYIIFDSILS